MTLFLWWKVNQTCVCYTWLAWGIQVWKVRAFWALDREVVIQPFFFLCLNQQGCFSVVDDDDACSDLSDDDEEEQWKLEVKEKSKSLPIYPLVELVIVKSMSYIESTYSHTFQRECSMSQYKFSLNYEEICTCLVLSEYSIILWLWHSFLTSHLKPFIFSHKLLKSIIFFSLFYYNIQHFTVFS